MFSVSKLLEASKKVASATKGLVDAAGKAADFKEEQQAAADRAKYSLSDAKIKEMEEQMEILRLERELEMKRKALLDNRKREYAEATGRPSPAKGKKVTIKITIVLLWDWSKLISCVK